MRYAHTIPEGKETKDIGETRKAIYHDLIRCSMEHIAQSYAYVQIGMLLGVCYYIASTYMDARKNVLHLLPPFFPLNFLIVPISLSSSESYYLLFLSLPFGRCK